MCFILSTIDYENSWVSDKHHSYSVVRNLLQTDTQKMKGFLCKFDASYNLNKLLDKERIFVF